MFVDGTVVDSTVAHMGFVVAVGTEFVVSVVGTVAVVEPRLYLYPPYLPAALQEFELVVVVLG